jgi:hypothetical protein
LFIIFTSTQFSIDTLYVMQCYYKFRLIAAIIRYIQFLYIHPLLMSATLSYTGQCLHTGLIMATVGRYM